MITKNKLILFISTLILPAISLAAVDFELGAKNFKWVVLYVIDILNTLIPILFTLALLVFFWGLSKFILNSGSQTEVTNGKNYMIWGVVVLFILISFRAIISLVTSDLGFGDARTEPILKTGLNASVSTSEEFRLPQ